MVLGNLDIHQKNKTRYHFLPDTKINAKLIKILNVRLETLELLPENTGHSGHWNRQEFSGSDPKSIGNKSKSRQ